MMRIAVVGGGASGTLAAAQLVRHAARRGTGLQLDVFEPGELGQGIAYGTTDFRHRLNVPAEGMSAWPDDPGHFVRWLQADHDAGFAPSGYAPRPVYGRYLADVLADELRSAPAAEVAHRRLRVTDLRPGRDGVCLRTSDQHETTFDAVVLALGNGEPSTAWAPATLRRSSRFVADPWCPGALPALPNGSRVVTVGSGLTMVDVAMTYGACRIHAVSRHGLVPLPHARVPSIGVAPNVPAGPMTVPQLRHLLFQHVRVNGGDWRAAVDSLRPVTSALWGALDDIGRREFVNSAQRRWDRVRHRMDPELADWLDARRRTVAGNRLTVSKATVVGAGEADSTIDVQLSDGTCVSADLVVNCTGPSPSVSASRDDLVSSLLRRGTARPGPLGYGFATDRSGRLVSHGAIPAWTLGPLRRGELWESTAVPEIREQARCVASDIVEVLSSQRNRAHATAGSKEVA